MATMLLSRAHCVFHHGYWRHFTASSFCSIAARFKALPVLDTDSTYAGAEVLTAIDGDQTSVWQSGAVLPQPPSDEKRVQVRLRLLRAAEHGLHEKLIPRSTWKVLDNLRDAGHEVYLVGGSVRDLLLKQVPKDFDVLTTADPGEIKKSFPGRCFIVGRRFPICHVNSQGTIIEVSSFSTELHGKKADRCKSGTREQEDTIFDGAEGWDDRDFARWENCLKRDFTINALMYDPFKHLLYDYIGGLRDLSKLKVRAVISAEKSFTEDSARMLRAIRIAARLGFKFSKSTSRAIKDQRFSLLNLNKGRLMLETNMLFSYGAAEPSLRLLWRYGVLELLLPLQAAYFVASKFRRADMDTNLLLDLFRNLDKAVAPDRPCHGSLWVALLAFHLAISETKCSPVVIATAALTMFHNDDKVKAAQKAKRILLRAQGKTGMVNSDMNVKEESLMEEANLLLENAKSCLNRMMDTEEITQVTRGLTGTEPETLVCAGQTFSQKAYAFFKRATADECDGCQGDEKKDRRGIESITRGDPHVICYVFSRIVLNTCFPRGTNRQMK